MIKFIPVYKWFVLLVVALFSMTIHADDRVVYGSLDDFSKNEIVVSDRAFSVSKLVSCSDLQGRSVVGCGGIDRMKWVELTIQRDGKVKKIKQISQAQYEKEVNSLD